MSQSIIGLENVQPYKFSECSRSDYIDALRIGHGLCLLNKPNEVCKMKTNAKSETNCFSVNSLRSDEIAVMESSKMAKTVTVDRLMTAVRKILVVIQLLVSSSKRPSVLLAYAAIIVK